MIDTVANWFKALIWLCLAAMVAWWGITHAALLAHVIVTVLDAIKVFFTTLANGVFAG